MRSGIKGLNTERIESARSRRAGKTTEDVRPTSNGTIRKFLEWGRKQNGRVPITL